MVGQAVIDQLISRLSDIGVSQSLLVDQQVLLAEEHASVLDQLVRLRDLEHREAHRNAQAAAASQPAAAPQRRQANDLQVGDRVIILSWIAIPARRPNRADIEGTVTKLTERRVKVRTDAGTETYRARHNVRLLN